MIELYGLTALDAIRVAGPYIAVALSFSFFTWMMIYITEVRVNRRWLRDPANMERTVQDQLARKNVIIRQLQSEKKELREDNVRLAAIVRGVRSRVIGGIDE